MNAIGVIWRIVAMFLPRTPARLKNVLVFREIPPDDLLRQLVLAYQVIYKESWGEDWPAEKIDGKLRQELRGGILVLLMRGDTVAGFSWGANVSRPMVVDRIVASFPTRVKGLEQGLEGLIRRLPERFFYWDEIALRLDSRGGLEPIRCLTQPLLAFAREMKTVKVAFRTTPSANIFRFTKLMGFKQIFQRKVGGTDEVYLLLDDLRPLLEVASRAPKRLVANIMKLLSGKARR